MELLIWLPPPLGQSPALAAGPPPQKQRILASIFLLLPIRKECTFKKWSIFRELHRMYSDHICLLLHRFPPDLAPPHPCQLDFLFLFYNLPSSICAAHLLVGVAGQGGAKKSGKTAWNADTRLCTRKVRVGVSEHVWMVYGVNQVPGEHREHYMSQIKYRH